MTDLYFRHGLSIAIDVAQVVEVHAGEVLRGVPDDLAKVLLRRADVYLTSQMPGGFTDDVRSFDFAAARRCSPGLARMISPPLDEIKLVEDLEKAERAAAAKKRLAELRAL